jgi:hypothetical protein
MLVPQKPAPETADGVETAGTRRGRTGTATAAAAATRVRGGRVLLEAEARKSSVELSYGAAAALARARRYLGAAAHWVGFGGRWRVRRRGQRREVYRYSTELQIRFGMNMFVIYSSRKTKCEPNNLSISKPFQHISWIHGLENMIRTFLENIKMIKIN